MVLGRLPLRRALLLAAVAAGAAPGVASGQTVFTQSVFDRRGDPVFVANPAPEGSKGKVAFALCPPDGGTCVARRTSPAAVLEAGPTPAGTLLIALVDYQGVAITARSAPWGGRVTARSRPALRGAARVGGRVVPVPAQWSGGWPGDYDLLRVQACRRRDGTDCRTLSAPNYGRKPPARVTIGARYAGWYLQAVDERVAREASFQYIDPLAPGPALRASQTVALSRLVRVAGARR